MEDDVVVVDDLLLLLLAAMMLKILTMMDIGFWRLYPHRKYVVFYHGIISTFFLFCRRWREIFHPHGKRGVFDCGVMTTFSFFSFVVLFVFFLFCHDDFCSLTPIFLLLVVSPFDLSLSLDFEGFASGSHPSTKVIFLVYFARWP